MKKNRIYDVSDVLDMAYLQKFQDSLGNVTKITTVILDPQGIPISTATNLYSFCAMMQTSETGVKMCRATNAKLAELNIKTRKPAVLMCPNSGLKTAAVPIFLKDQYLGSWLIGQLRTDDLDLNLIEQTSIKAGLSPEVAKANIQRLPIVTESEFQNILDLVNVMTKEVTQLVEMNAALDEKNSVLTDLTNKLDISAKAFREFIDLSDIGVYLSNYETDDIIMFNHAFSQLIHKETEAIQGEKCYDLIGLSIPCLYCPKETLLNEEGEPGEPVIWERYFEKVGLWLQVTSRALRWIDGNLAYMATFVDITDRKRREEEMEYLAYYDQKLDLPNLIRLFHDLDKLKGEELYLICFDIQGLRKINDIYGRESGDILLKEIKDWILTDKRFQNNFYKVGNDEFVILLHNVGNERAFELATKVCERFEEVWYIDLGIVHHQIYAGLSIGILSCEHGFSTTADLINMIERILSVASAKNQLINYGSLENEEFHNHLKLEMSLKKCVLGNMQGFYLNYQPIVDPASGLWRGIEALCRWDSPEIGRIPPNIFIPEAEQNGLISLIGEWVLEKALKQVKEWGLERSDFILDVNLSPIQLNDRNLYERIVKILKSTDYPPNKLSLEITESAEVNFSGHILETLLKLRALGVELSLDDFGTGYATFSNLINLPVTNLKTDRSFMNNIENDLYLQNTIKIMVEFAHSANMRVIAEGVENKAQKRILQQLAVDFIQGFYYSKPLSAEEITQNLNKFAANADSVPIRLTSNIDLNTLMDPDDGYILPTNLYRLLIHCFFLFNRDLNHDPMEESMKIVGEKLDAAQVFVTYMDAEDETSLLTWEWVREDIDAARRYLITRQSIMERIDLFERDGLSSAFREDNIADSMLILPLMRDKLVYGVLGIGDKAGPRIWRPEEIQFLYYLCILYDNYIKSL